MTLLQQKRTVSLTLSLAVLLCGSVQIDGAVQEEAALRRKRARQIRSVFSSRQVRLNGLIETGEWENAAANQFRVTHGWLAAQNDASFLYVLVDLTGDTQDDPPLRAAPWGDYVSLTFDVDLDKRITPSVDRMYGSYPGTRDVGVSLYLRPGVHTGLSTTSAKLGAGFGSSRNGLEPHRIWEFSIPLNEINATPSGKAHIGLRVHSQNPAFADLYPATLLNEFSDLYEIVLAAPKGSATDSTGRPARVAQIERKVLPDGTIEFRYPDGHRKRILPRGGVIIIDSDGTEHAMLYANSVYPSLPALPRGSNLSKWLEKLNEELLNKIKTILNNNQEEIDAYLQVEGNVSVDEQIIKRTRFLFDLIPR